MRSGSLDAGRSSRRKRSPRQKRHKMQMSAANELDPSNTNSNSAVPSTSNSPVLSRKDISVAEMNADAVGSSQEALSSLGVEVSEPVEISEHISISATESCFKSLTEKEDSKVDEHFELNLNQDEVFQEDAKVDSLPVQVSY